MGTVMSMAYLAQDAEHQQLEWLDHSVMRVLLDGAATEGQLTMLRTSLPEGAASPVHLHSNEDEMFVLLSGSGIFWFGDERWELGEGGVVYLPRNVPHAYRFTSAVDLLTICTPSGSEGFFRKAGHDLSTPKPEGWAITPATLGEAAAAHGVTIVGPPRPA
jgi:quercetin dioxygenase-like cupin family protein